MELEEKLQKLLERTESSRTTPVGEVDDAQHDPYRIDEEDMDTESVSIDMPESVRRRGSRRVSSDMVDAGSTAANPDTKPFVPWLSDGQLASELENLSLKAIAERPFLGSSSGVSFARLTQAVLRRLQPDQYSFTGGQHVADNASRNQNQNPWEAQMMPPSHRVPLNEYPEASLPSMEEASYLEEFYWSHSHTLYPFLQKTAFKKILSEIYAEPDRLDQLPASVSYRLWMVFAIGSTTLYSVGMGNGNRSVAYFEKAMKYFEGALMEGSIVWQPFSFMLDQRMIAYSSLSIGGYRSTHAASCIFVLQPVWPQYM